MTPPTFQPVPTPRRPHPGRGGFDLGGPEVFFLAVGGAVLLLGALPWPLRAHLVYARDAVAEGEVWRLVTSSLVHLHARHMLWNLAALAGLAVALRRSFGALAWSAVAFLSALGAGAGLFLLSPATPAMAGLSALLHGLAAAGGLAQLVRGRRPLGALLLLLLVAKLAWEQAVGPLPGVVAVVGGRVAVDAHLYGASAGWVAAGLLLAAEGRRRPLRSRDQTA